MAGGPIKRVAKAIRDQDKQTADYGVREVEFADVRQLSPLLLELHDANIQLEEEDLILSQDFKVYDDATGLAVGDTVAVKQMRGGDFLVLDVFSDTTPASPSGASDATTTAKGIIQLAGDLAGTAASPQIAVGAIGTSELATDAVTADKIAADAVGSSEIATDAVGTAEIAADAVTASEIATDAVGTAEIAADAVTSSEIAADAVGASEIAAGAVGTSEIAADAVTADKIATDAVGSSEIAADAVGSSEIAADAVGSSEIAADAVGSSEIAADAVGSSEIAANAVGTSELDTGAVTSAKIADGTIVNDDVSTSAAISHSKLATTTAGYLLLGGTGGTITGTALSGDATITSAGVLTIANDAINAAKIATDAVDTDEIKAGAVGNAEVASGAAIALSKLATGSSGQIIVVNGSGVPTYVAMSGDTTTSNAGAITVKKFTGPGSGGSGITDIYYGITTLATGGAAQNNTNLTIPWGNFAPTVVMATVGEASNYAVMTSAYTSTGSQGQFNIRIRHTDGTAQAATITLAYLAIR